MTVFITGATGYLGSYVCDSILREQDDDVVVLVRAKDRGQAVDKLWRAWQLHMDGPRFHESLRRVRFAHGDLTAPGLGLDAATRAWVTGDCDSVIHIAASLNRRSEKACLNTNLRGTLSVIKLAREIADGRGLRRFSHVSTVAVAGERDREVVHEDDAIDWDRRDYDPYGRTKKFCEHMVRELLPDVPLTFLRPSIVMGDSRFPETSQFDMVRATCILADLPVVPFRGDARVDIVNADWVGKAIARIHFKDAPKHAIYHLSAGLDSRTTQDVADALSAVTGRRARFVPALEGGFSRIIDAAAGLRARNSVQLVGSLFKVFLPYITYDTVFDNRRAIEEVGEAPVPFTEYGTELYRFAKRVGFEYPYRPLPAAPDEIVEAPRAEGRA